MASKLLNVVICCIYQVTLNVSFKIRSKTILNLGEKKENIKVYTVCAVNGFQVIP